MSNRRWIWLAVAVSVSAPLGAQTAAEGPEPVLTLSFEEGQLRRFPADFLAIDISESGGITDMFLRVTPASAPWLAAFAAVVPADTVTVSVCSVPLETARLQIGATGETIYLAHVTAVQAEAIRALWHGRARCADFAAGLTANGQ